MAAQGPPPSRRAHPYDPTVSRRIDWIVIHYEAAEPKTLSRAWWRLQKLITERQIPGWLPEGGRP